jgi:outer membrane protein assembly factor BamB
MKQILTYLLYSFLFIILSASASDPGFNQWSRFRGSDGLGIDLYATAPVQWNDSDLTWKITLPGTGHSSPVVWGNLLFINSADDEKDLGYLMAINDQNGEVLWQKEFKISDLVMHVDNNLASPSAAVDESQVYTIWYAKEKTNLYALDHNGGLRWQAEFDGIEARHGGGSSLALTDKFVVFTREQEEGSALKSSWVAVDKMTGKIAWELERESASSNSFSTPLPVNFEDGKKQLIFTSMAHGFTGVDPETGEVLWERKSMLPDRTVASPVYANGMIIGCRRGGAVVIEVDPKTHQAVQSEHYSLPPNLSPYVPTPIVVGEFLYLFMDNGTVACLRMATGELQWKKRPSGPIYGSPVCIGGNLYCITKAGKVIVIAASPAYELLGISELGEESFATPVMCPAGMVFRTYTHLMLLGNQQIIP